VRYVCCDPSLTAFGIAVIENGDLSSYDCVVTKTETHRSKGAEEIIRLRRIAKALRESIGDERPCMVLFEDPSGSKSAVATRSLGLVKGLVIGVCTALGVDFIGIPVGVVKRTMLGRLVNDKQAMWEAVSVGFAGSGLDPVGQLPDYKRFAISDSLAVYMTAAKKQYI
jgi:Holliday junction resolvasome RuvABC endonuclease subunit